MTDLNAIFVRTWEALADLGKCDGLGGAEYRRVFRTWERYGSPLRQLEDFIVTHANTGSDGTGREKLN